VVLCVAGAARICAQDAAPVLSARPGPDAVLVWGHGLHRVDLQTGEFVTWLDASHVIRKVCWAPDAGPGAGTVFVVEQGQVARLEADTGRAVAVPLAGGADARAVRSRDVLDLAAAPAGLVAIELDRGPGGDGSGQPFCARAGLTPPASIAAGAAQGASRDPMDLLAPGTPLDAAPDRICGGTAFGAEGVAFVALSPAAGLGPRVWNAGGELPRPQPQPADERWFAQGFALAARAPRGFALLAAPFSATRLLACDLSGGLAAGTWSVLRVKLPQSEPQLMSLYLCTADGSGVLVGNGKRLQVLDGGTGGRRAELALADLGADSEVVLDACLVELPHDGAGHAAVASSPGAAPGGKAPGGKAPGDKAPSDEVPNDGKSSDEAPRDEAWIAGVFRVTDGHGAWAGAMALAVWDLRTGALLRRLPLPEGVGQVTTLPASRAAPRRRRRPVAQPLRSRGRRDDAARCATGARPPARCATGALASSVRDRRAEAP